MHLPIKLFVRIKLGTNALNIQQRDQDQTGRPLVIRNNVTDTVYSSGCVNVHLSLCKTTEYHVYVLAPLAETESIKLILRELNQIYVQWLQ